MKDDLKVFYGVGLAGLLVGSTFGLMISGDYQTSILMGMCVSGMGMGVMQLDF